MKSLQAEVKSQALELLPLVGLAVSKATGSKTSTIPRDFLRTFIFASRPPLWYIIRLKCPGTP